MTSPPSTNPAEGGQPAKLTQDDVKQLLSESATGGRQSVASKIARQHREGQFNERELLIAEQIFRLLLRDTEVQVRAAMADGLKDDEKVPKDIIKTLASDVEDVASPVLEHSDVLDDDDLLEIIENHDEITKFIAISRRKSVSGPVSAALVETEIEDVVDSLVKNDGADIPEESYSKIITDFPDHDGIMEGLVDRANLPVSVVESLLNVVSESVANELKHKYQGVAKQLEAEARKTRENMTIRLLDTTTDPRDVQALVDQMHASSRLTPSIIITALCRGNFTFFEVSLAKLAGIPSGNARKLIHDKGDLGYKAIYDKAGLPQSIYEASRLVLNVMRDMSARGEINPTSVHFSNRVVEQIFQRVEGEDVENLAYIIALIRQNNRT